MMRHDGRVAIVTGASRGIGLAIAAQLVREGAKVCITARKVDALAEAAATIGDEKSVITLPGSLGDPEHQRAAVQLTLETFGRLDILVNNAATNPAYGPLMDIDLSAGRRIFEQNVLGTIGWIQHAYRAALAAHGGSVVNVTSLAGLQPADGIGMYGASKAALTLLTRQLAGELGPRVRVNAVAPAVVKTKFAKVLYEDNEAELSERYPMKRLGVPEDVSGAVSFLASEEAAWITGQTLAVDGGVQQFGGL